MSELRRIRVDKRLSVEALAEQAGVSPRTLHRIERGAIPQFETLLKLADALGVQPSVIDPVLAEGAV